MASWLREVLRGSTLAQTDASHGVREPLAASLRLAPFARQVAGDGRVGGSFGPQSENSRDGGGLLEDGKEIATPGRRVGARSVTPAEARAPQLHAFCPKVCQRVGGTLADRFPFPLGYAHQDEERHAARRGSSVDPIGDRHQSPIVAGKVGLDEAPEIHDASRESIELRHEEGVGVTVAEHRQSALQTCAFQCLRAHPFIGRDLDEFEVVRNAVRVQSGSLGFEGDSLFGLAFGADPHVSDHASQ